MENAPAAAVGSVRPCVAQHLNLGELDVVPQGPVIVIFGTSNFKAIKDAMELHEF